MSYFITKYALTEGIQEYSEDQLSLFKESPSMLTGNTAHGLWHLHFHGEGKEWHRTREAAVARAEEMRKAKIISLKKSIAKMEALKF